MKLNRSLDGFTNFIIKNPAISLTLIYIYSSFVGAAYSKAFFNALNIEILDFCKLEDFLGIAFKQPWVLSLSYILLIVLYFFLKNTKFSNALIDFVLLIATHKRGKLVNKKIKEKTIDLRTRMKNFLIVLLLIAPFFVAINLGNSDSKSLMTKNRKTSSFKFVRSKYNHTATSTYKNSILPNSTNAQPSNKVNYSKFSSQGAFLDKFQPGGIQKGNVILVYHFPVL